MTPITTRFWLLTAAALAGAAATAALGFWQLSRAEEKQALRAAIDARALMPPLDNAVFHGALGAERVVHRRATLRGSWMAGHTVYLDNRQMNGKPGFFVLTPLQLEDGSMAVVVQRGWVQRNFSDRIVLPTVTTPAGVVEVEGRIAPAPSKLYEFDGSQGGDIRQNLDLIAFSQEVGLPLAPVSLLQTGSASDGLLRDWPEVQTGVAKHHGYAFQWFALSGLIVSLYVWFQLVRRFSNRRRPGPSG